MKWNTKILQHSQQLLWYLRTNQKISFPVDLPSHQPNKRHWNNSNGFCRRFPQHYTWQEYIHQPSKRVFMKDNCPQYCITPEEIIVWVQTISTILVCTTERIFHFIHFSQTKSKPFVLMSTIPYWKCEVYVHVDDLWIMGHNTKKVKLLITKCLTMGDLDYCTLFLVTPDQRTWLAKSISLHPDRYIQNILL